MSETLISNFNDVNILNDNNSQTTHENFIKIEEGQKIKDNREINKNSFEKQFASELNNLDHNSSTNTKSQSDIDKSNCQINPSLVVLPKENMNQLFTKLHSLTKLKTINSNEENKELTEHKDVGREIQKSDIIGDISDNNTDSKTNKTNYTTNTLKNTKNSIFTSVVRPNTVKGPRDTVMLDERFNVLEILNDKNNLLITESNENYTESSREETNDKFMLNYNNNRPIVNMTDYNLLKLEDSFNPLENYPTYDNLLHPSKKELVKNKILNLNELGRKVNLITNESLKKNSLNSQNFESNNKKTALPRGKHTKTTKSTDMSSLKQSMNFESISGSASIKLTQKSKNKVNSSNPVKRLADQKTSVTNNNNKNFNSTIKKINTTAKTPPRTFTPITSRTSKIINKDSKSKNLVTSVQKPQNSINLIKNKSPAQSQAQVKQRGSIVSIKRSETLNSNKNKSDIFTKQLVSEIIDEYDYSKILVELKSIFGENLEHFDENLLFSNLDELSNKGLIKGLIMLSHMQEKKIRLIEQMIASVKAEYNCKLKEKDLTIQNLEEELITFKSTLRGLMGEIPSDRSTYLTKSAKKNPINEKRYSFKNNISNK